MAQNKKKKSANNEPLSKKAKIILSCVFSVAIIACSVVALILGLNMNKSIFEYLVLEIDSATGTYKIVDVSNNLGGEVEIPSSYMGKKITIIDDNAFYGTKIEKLTLPNSITTFGNRAFANAKNLKYINCPDDLKYIGKECFLSSINLKKFTVKSGVETICESAFRNCQSLKTFEFKEGVKNIEKGVFGHCKVLETITLPATVENIGGQLFTYCTALEDIVVNEGNTNYKVEGNCLIEIETNKLLSGCKNSVIPEGVITIGESAFEGITNINAVTLPASVTTLEACAFYGCEALGSTSNGVVDISGVKTLGRMVFSGCKALTSVDVSGAVETMGNSVFAYCTNIETVTISAPNLSILPISAFIGCSKLETVSMTNVEVISLYAFGNCESLTSVTLSNTVSKIEANAFDGCVALTSIFIPNSVFEIQDYAFYNCSENLVLKMQAIEALTGYADKFNYVTETKQLTTEWGQKAN